MMRLEDNTLALGEVYYDEEGSPVGYVEAPMSPMGDNFEELLNDIRLMHLALQKPIFLPGEIKPSISLTDALSFLDEPEVKFPSGPNITWGKSMRALLRKKNK
jgi:hypothetical protein